MDDENKGTPFTLVADNSSTTLEERRAQQEFNRSASRATAAIKRLSVNLLRIIAGAGEPWELHRNLDEMQASYLDYLKAAERANRPVEPLTNELDLDNLFLCVDQDPEPLTEEGWLGWAQPSDPYEEYFENKARHKLELRRAALRQVASVLSSGDPREPHLKAHGGNLDDIIRRMLDAKSRFEQEKSRPPKQADPHRRAIADQKIAEIQRVRRKRQLESLAAHQIAALRAVEAKSVDQTDRFTLEVLGSMKLLVRSKGSTKKSDWHLTDDGQMALEIHKQSKP
jgi:hypothetical protein